MTNVERRRGRDRAAAACARRRSWSPSNAAAAGWKPLRRRLTVFGSYVVLTEPVPELLEQIGWTGGEAIFDGRMFLHYFRTTNDGRVLMGSGSGPIGFGGKVDRRFTHDEPTVARAEHGLRRLLPGLAEAKVTHAWGGPIDVSSDHLPFFGTVPGTRIHYGAGYSGHGAGPSWLGGQILARLALGVDDELTRLPLVTRRVPKLPPEPIRRLGGGLVRAAIMACEEAEEEERRPPLAGPSRRRAAAPARHADRHALVEAGQVPRPRDYRRAPSPDSDLETYPDEHLEPCGRARLRMYGRRPQTPSRHLRDRLPHGRPRARRAQPVRARPLPAAGVTVAFLPAFVWTPV